MFEHPYISYLVMKQRQEDALAAAWRERTARLALAGGGVRRAVGPRLLSALGKRMVSLGTRLQSKYGCAGRNVPDLVDGP